MSNISGSTAGPFQQQFPIGCLLATAGAFRSGFFYSNGQIHVLNILMFIVLIPVMFVVGGVIDATFFTRRKIKLFPDAQRDSRDSAVNPTENPVDSSGSPNMPAGSSGLRNGSTTSHAFIPVILAVTAVAGGCSSENRKSVSVPVSAAKMATSPSPVSLQNAAMLEATQRAWAGMQAIDAEADNIDSGPYPSKGLRQVAYAYSQLPLANVDPAFVKHILRGIGVMKKAVTTLERIEAKRDQLDAQENSAAEFGAALGAAAAANDGASPQQAAGISNFLGLMAAASTSGARSTLEAECANALRPIEAELKAFAQAEAELADYLSQKYGVPFIDPF